VTSRPSATALRAARRVFPIDVEIPDDAFDIGQTSLKSSRQRVDPPPSDLSNRTISTPLVTVTIPTFVIADKPVMIATGAMPDRFEEPVEAFRTEEIVY
jgi:hypothetical protein